MGIFTETFSPLATLIRERNVTSWSGVQQYISGVPQWNDGKYASYAREGYMTNALVYACIQELASSVSEPGMRARQGSRWIHPDDGTATAAARLLALITNPNRFMDGREMWRTVVLHVSLAGNAYALKVRSGSGRPVELWMLRPDRVTIVPSATNFIERYEYNVGDREPIRIPADDVIHFKAMHPLNDFYGMPVLMPLAQEVDIDNYSRRFVRTYFERAGVPSGILSTKGRMPDDQKKEIRDRFTNNFGNGQWHGLMVIDGQDATYTAMTQSLGAQGLVLPDLNKIVEARIAGAFGVPLSLVGTVLGLEASSYGNKQAEREGFYAETILPMWRELMGPVKRSLLPDFPGVTDIEFDKSQASALQEDADKRHTRVRADANGGIISLEEARKEMGYEETLPAGHTFLIPSNLTQTPSEDVGKPPEPPAAQPAPVGAPASDEPTGA